MIFLDTDHVTVLSFSKHSLHARLSDRISAASGEAFAVTIVSVEEQMRGWLARINRLKGLHEQVGAYRELRSLFRFFQEWEIVDFDATAADEVRRLRHAKIRIGTMDLKIAAIALTRNALLLTANLTDFRQIPGLRVENWLTE